LSTTETQNPGAASTAGVKVLNSLTRDEFVSLILETCHLPVPSWADKLEQARPFVDARSLVASAQSLVAQLTDDEVVAAHAGLTRLGERRQTTSERQARWSRIESAGIPQDPAILDRFARANREYEDKFGHVFLISATGLQAEDMLAAMDQRVHNDRSTENDVIRGELATLVQLRLDRLTAEMGSSVAGGGQ
jgi:2-oxo-4-hydroxy-4-carboxy-5-ureidoimidazoline decarboxylase